MRQKTQKHGLKSKGQSKGKTAKHRGRAYMAVEDQNPASCSNCQNCRKEVVPTPWVGEVTLDVPPPLAPFYLEIDEYDEEDGQEPVARMHVGDDDPSLIMQDTATAYMHVSLSPSAKANPKTIGGHDRCTCP